MSDLLQLEHEHPVLGVLVERVDDELGEIDARAVRVLRFVRGVRVPPSTVTH